MSVERISILPENGRESKPIFSSYEEYRKHCEKVYKRIAPEIRKNALRRARSEARARGLNPDAVKL